MFHCVVNKNNFLGVQRQFPVRNTIQVSNPDLSLFAVHLKRAITYTIYFLSLNCAIRITQLIFAYAFDQLHNMLFSKHTKTHVRGKTVAVCKSRVAFPVCYCPVPEIQHTWFSIRLSIQVCCFAGYECCSVSSSNRNDNCFSRFGKKFLMIYLIRRWLTLVSSKFPIHGM